MTRKRSRTKIQLEVLQTCVDGARLTRIVYQCNLNFRTVRPYLAELQEKGLLSTDGLLYRTTDAGRDTMAMLRASGVVG